MTSCDAVERSEARKRSYGRTPRADNTFLLPLLFLAVMYAKSYFIVMASSQIHRCPSIVIK